MSDELERLRADLEVLERHDESIYVDDIKRCLRDKIARLEAEVDPWWENYKAIEKWRKMDDGGLAWEPERNAVALVNHLTAERDRLAARVAELEGANEPPFWPSESEIRAIKPQDEKAIMDAAVELMEGLGGKLDPDDFGNTSPPKFEIAANRTVKYTEAGPLKPRDVSAEINDVDDDPILDHARVLATARQWLNDSDGLNHGNIGFRIDTYCRDAIKDAKPYRLKGGGDE